MSCYQHPETPAVAYCRSCGRGLCAVCQRTEQGTIYCEEHVPAPAPPPPGDSSPYTAPPYRAPLYTAPPTPLPDAGVSPGLAFLIGIIPGVGAIYNAQYAKGLVHVIILGLLISIINNRDSAGGFEPLFGLLIAIWIIYMPFEAYHTALRRHLGQPVDEFSSLFAPKGQPSGVPVAPIVLIGLGVLFLLNTMDLIRFNQLLRYWPVFLIVLGVYMLVNRVSPQRDVLHPEATHERH